MKKIRPLIRSIIRSFDLLSSVVSCLRIIIKSTPMCDVFRQEISYISSLSMLTWSPMSFLSFPNCNIPAIPFLRLFHWNYILNLLLVLNMYFYRTHSHLGSFSCCLCPWDPLFFSNYTKYICKGNKAEAKMTQSSWEFVENGTNYFFGGRSKGVESRLGKIKFK